MINLFLRFAAVGAVGTAVHYLILILMVRQFGVPPPLGAVVGSACGALVNYYLNRKYNFAGSGDHRRAAPRFVALVVMGIILNGVLVNFFSAVGLHYLVAQVFTTLFILGLNFIVCKKWIFIKTK